MVHPVVCKQQHIRGILVINRRVSWRGRGVDQAREGKQVLEIHRIDPLLLSLGRLPLPDSMQVSTLPKDHDSERKP